MVRIGNKIYFRHVDWNKDRPKLFDLLKELEINSDLAGVFIWRDNQPYIVATSEIASAAARIDRVCKIDDGITDRELRRAVGSLSDRYEIKIKDFTMSDLIDSQTETDPFNIEDKLSDIIWSCGLERSDYETIFNWIKEKFPAAAEKFEKQREKYKTDLQ